LSSFFILLFLPIGVDFFGPAGEAYFLIFLGAIFYEKTTTGYPVGQPAWPTQQRLTFYRQNLYRKVSIGGRSVLRR